MLKNSKAFSGFSVDDLEKAKHFYKEVLELDIHEEENMGLRLKLDGTTVFIYPKSNHKAASFTVLNFVVENIDKAMDELVKKGVEFEHYDLGNGIETDEKGVLRGLSEKMGPDIAWFKDPAGNVLSVLQEE